MNNSKIIEIIKFFNQYKVGFATNFHNVELLQMSTGLYKFLSSNNQIIMVNGMKGLYGYNVFNMLLSDLQIQRKYDYLVYIDEDCFISDIEEMYETIKKFINDGYWFAGMPDGGVISHRFHNPISINTFFTIFNIKEIKNVYKLNCAKDCMYDESLLQFTPFDLIKSECPDPNEERVKIVINEGYIPYDVNYDNFEPYYRIFFYLLKNGAKPLYLNGDDAPEMDGDGACTKLYGVNNKIFCYHTWFARNYTDSHNKRIKSIYEKVRKMQK